MSSNSIRIVVEIPEVPLPDRISERSAISSMTKGALSQQESLAFTEIFDYSKSLPAS
jgi:hypothetical protein